MLFFVLAVLFTPILASVHSCDISQAKLVLPANQTALPPPPDSPPLYIASAFGVQNYTCNATSSKWVSIGAVAELIDISCLYGTPEFNQQDGFYTLWTQLPDSVTILDVISFLGSRRFVLGQHYFITNPIGTTPAILPKWDFTSASQQGNPNAYIVGSKIGDLPAPTGPNDVDWLLLKGVAGGLAKEVYRVDTKAGQPPASCTPGSPVLSVKYGAKYWFY